MILFLNVFITDQGFTKYKRGLIPSSNRANIFKYMVTSLSVIDWSHVIIYYDLDTNYQHRRSEIDEYIRTLFPDPVIYPFRNERQEQWKDAVHKVSALKDDLIWFSCNDDHIFIDYETGLLNRIETKLRDLTKSHEYVSCHFSHWPEMQYFSRIPPGHTKVGAVEEHKDYFIAVSRNCDSVQIVNNNLLRYWWFEHDYGDSWMPKTDSPSARVISPETMRITPYRELVRHFDGYSHNRININICPPLFIPDGFFGNGIKILYCSDTGRKGYVHVNPLKKNYTTVDSAGADLKCLLEDLPLFWQPRIGETKVAKHENRELLIRRRNEAVLKMVWQKIQLPVTKLEVALRFDDSQIPLEELRKLEVFRRNYRITNFLPSLVRLSIFKLRLSLFELPNKLLHLAGSIPYLRNLKQSLTKRLSHI
ncbi:hypothetical protein ACFLYQ_07770 [Chloroflexota bacterium]